ncbi:hypothetical protein LINGRAHAP2_LOCUS34868, partial [Linum grandiflorum]
ELLDHSPTFKLLFKPVKFEFPFPKPPFSSIFVHPRICLFVLFSSALIMTTKRQRGSSSRKLPNFIDRLVDEELTWYERNKDVPAAATCALDIDS